MKKKPGGFGFHDPAFIGCVRWALGRDDFRAQFKKDTGFDIDSLVRASPIEKMIDTAAGRTEEILATFCDWVVVNIWGEEKSDAAAQSPQQEGD
jgi:hypothetical protein